MKIEINKLTSEKIGVNFLKKVAERTAKLVKLKFPELSVAIVCDARMKTLNKKYRNKNRVTDVLAFDYGLPFNGQGEIVICLSQAKRQAKKLKHSLKQELATLLIHGILHLVGYGDENKRNFNIMHKKQNKILKEVYGKN